MIISKKISMLLPTVQFANTTIEVLASLDTTNSEDVDTVKCQEGKTIGEKLSNFVMEEIFATKESLEECAAKNFALQTDFSKENARLASMQARR